MLVGRTEIVPTPMVRLLDKQQQQQQQPSWNAITHALISAPEHITVDCRDLHQNNEKA